MSQLKKGALLSYTNLFLTSAIGLIITPFIITNIGNSEYGLYVLIGGIIGYFSSLDLGLNNTVIRYVSKYLAENDKKGEDKFISTIMMIYFFISMIIIVLGGLFYLKIDSFFSDSLSVNELDNAKTMFVILIFNLAISLPGGAFNAICDAYEKFSIPRGLSILKYSLRAILIFTIISRNSNALMIVWIDTIVNVLAIILAVAYVYSKLKIRIKFSFKFDKSLLKETFSYSIWIFIAAIAYKLQWNAGQTILGMNVNSQSVAIFGIGVMLASYYTVFASIINSLLLPKSTQMVVKNTKIEEYTSFVIQVGRINLLLLLPIISGFFLFGELFIELWVGNDYKQSWLIALIIMAVMTLPLVTGLGNYILEAKNKNRFKAILNLSTLTIASIVGFYLSKKYDFLGMLIPLAITILINNLVLIGYFKKVFAFNFKLFIQKVFLKAVLINLILVVCCYFLINIFKLNGWVDLIIAAIVYLLLYTLTNYFLVLNKDEKKLTRLNN